METPDRILQLAEFLELSGMSRTQEWRLRKIPGALPPLVVVNGRIQGRRLSDYHRWLEACAANQASA